MIKKILAKVMPVHMRNQLVNFKILAMEYGQYKTIKDWNCIDKDKNEIPWYTYPAIEYLNNIDFSDKLIFEYGSGNSSLYWSVKSKKVVSIEHDVKWYEKIKSNINNNQNILLKKDAQEYEIAISTIGEKYDVVIIDGIRRPECSRVIKNVLNLTSSEGYMVILDNSDWYKNTAKYLREELNLIEIDFHGFGPINNYTWTTSIFMSRNFNFKVLENIQPNFSIAGLEQSGE